MAEFMIFILLVVLVILFSNLRSELRKKAEEIRYEIMALRHRIEDLEKKPKGNGIPPPPAPEPVKMAPVVPPPVPPPVPPQPEIISTPESEPVAPVVVADAVPSLVVPPPVPDMPPPVPKVEEQQPEPVLFTAPEEPQSTDIEKFIGENLINKIGIAILVLGIGYFVKYAIDKDWINEAGRLLIGLLCGSVLIGIAHRLRTSYRAFSSVLVAGGISVFYFSIAIGFHEYQLMSQATAFAVMVLITAFAVLLAVFYDRKELAVLSIIGGFATPFMVSTGEGNFRVLFTYLLILNVGMLVLAFYKRWNMVRLLCYIFTVLIFGAWVVRSMAVVEGGTAWGLLFATLFYGVFLAMTLVPMLRQPEGPREYDYLFLLTVNLFYFAVGMHALQGTEFRGVFAGGMAAVNFGLAWILYHRQQVSRNLVYLLIGMVLTLISLVGPLQLHGNYITLFWAAEVPLLLWFSRQSGLPLVRYFVPPVLAVMLISLLGDWVDVYRNTAELALFINKGFTTGLFAMAALLVSDRLLQRETDANFFPGIPTGHVRPVVRGLALLGLYVVFLLEFHHHLQRWCETGAQLQTLLALYHLGWVNGYALAAKRNNNEVRHYLAMSLTALAVMVYLFNWRHQFVVLRNDHLTGATTTAWIYPLHLLAAGLLGWALVQGKQLYYSRVPGLSDRNVLRWVLAGLTVILFSAETDQLVLFFSYTPGRLLDVMAGHNHKIAWPILWGICSSLFMYIGMKFKARMWRIISLSLFSLTLLKLFVYDIRGISDGGKIAAFISLGVLLLVVSFMYQKLKTLLLDDEADAPKTSDN